MLCSWSDSKKKHEISPILCASVMLHVVIVIVLNGFAWNLIVSFPTAL